MSLESGIPTYRGTGEVWKEYNYREYACQEAFESADGNFPGNQVMMLY
jgi:NAD-dependent deacetylase